MHHKESETGLDTNLNRCKGFGVPTLDDGNYDAIVVDAVEQPDGTMTIELALSSGPHRGEVVNLNAAHIGRTWIDLLASPATLIVRDGMPRLTFDD